MGLDYRIESAGLPAIPYPALRFARMTFLYLPVSIGAGSNLFVYSTIRPFSTSSSSSMPKPGPVGGIIAPFSNTIGSLKMILCSGP